MSSEEENVATQVGEVVVRFGKVNIDVEDESKGIWFKWKVQEDVQGKSQIGECVSGDVDYSGKWANVELTARNIGSLADGGHVTVEAFIGESGESEEDDLMGSVVIPLKELFVGKEGKIHDSFQLCNREAGNPEEIQSIELEVTIEAKEDLKTYCHLGRFLQIESGALFEVPEAWEHVASSSGGICTLQLFGDYSVPGKIELSEEELKSEMEEEEKYSQSESKEESSKKFVKICPADNSAFPLIFLPESIVEIIKASTSATHPLKFIFPAPPADPKAKGEPPAFDGTALGTISFDCLHTIDAVQLHTTDLKLEVRKQEKPSNVEHSKDNKKQEKAPPTKGAKGGKAEIKEPEAAEESHEPPPPPVFVKLDLDLSIFPPLFPKEPVPQAPLPIPREIIEGRPPRKIRQLTGDDLIRQSVAAITSVVSGELEALMMSEDGEIRENAVEQKKKVGPRLFYSLTTSGKYLSIREMMKDAVSKYVSERKGKLVASGGDNLFSAIYESVMDAVHVTLRNKLTSVALGQQFMEGESPPASIVSKDLSVELARLQSLAEDAMAENQLEQVEYLLQKRVSEAEKACTKPSDYDLEVDPSVWFDLGLFSMKRGAEFQAVAAECFRTAISLSDQHLKSLVAYGVLLAEVDPENSEQIEVFLSAAHQLSPAEEMEKESLVLSYGTLLLVENCKGEPLVDPCKFLAQIYPSRNAEEAYQDENQAILAILTYAGRSALEWNLVSLAEKLLSRRLQVASRFRFQSNDESRCSLLNTKLLDGWLAFLQGDSELAGQIFRKAIEMDRSRAEPYLLLSTLTPPENSDEELELFQRAMDLRENLPDNPTASLWIMDVPIFFVRRVMLQLGKALASRKCFEDASNVYSLLCLHWPTLQSWIGLGEAQLGLENFQSAIEAFSEANKIERCDNNVWGYLSLSCFCEAVRSQGTNSNDDFERLGMVSLDQANRLGLDNAQLLSEIGRVQFKLGRLSEATISFEKAISNDPLSPQIKCDLARVAIYRHRFHQAHEILSELQHSNSSDDVQNAVKTLTALSAKVSSLC